MAKIIYNLTASDIFISDTGVNIPASGNYVVPAQDYLIWAASSEVVTQINSGNLIVNTYTINESKRSLLLELDKEIYFNESGWSSNNVHDAILESSGGGSTGIVILSVPCDSSVYVGAAVRMTSGGTAVNALADSESNANVIGICETKSSSTVCGIRVSGKSLGIYSGLDVTKEYFLSSSVAGLLTATPVIGSGNVLLSIGQPFSATEFVVSKGTKTVRK